jgi:hypothetical protein
MSETQIYDYLDLMVPLPQEQDSNSDIALQDVLNEINN